MNILARTKNLDEITIAMIRDLYSKGEYTQKELAMTFSLSQSTVCKIINQQIHKPSGIKIFGEAIIKVGYNYGD